MQFLRQFFGGSEAAEDRRFTSAAAWLVSGAAARGVLLLANLAVARLLVPVEFGQLALLQTGVLLMAGVSGLGLAVSITRQVAHTRTFDPLAAGQHIATALKLTAIIGTLIATCLSLGRDAVAAEILGDAELSNVVLPASVAVAFAAVMALIEGALLGLESFRTLAIARWILAVGVSTGLVVGAAVSDLTGAVQGFASGTAIATVASFILLRREARRVGARLDPRLDPASRIELFRLAAPAFVAFLVVAVTFFVGQALLARQPSGFDELAIFNVAQRWHLIVLFVPAAIAPGLVPMMTNISSSGNKIGAKAIFQKNLRLAIILTAVPTVVLVVAAPVAMGLSGAFYASHPGPLVILALATIPIALNNVLSSASLSLGLIKAWLASDVALAIAFFATLVPALDPLGASGLALAYLVGYVASDALLVRPVFKRLG